MPVNQTIIDAHLHLWDPGTLRYPWLDENEALNRPYSLEDFRNCTKAHDIEAMVFVQCEARPEDFLAEAFWVREQSRRDPRIRGLVAWAPLEKGRRVEDDLDKLGEIPILRGVRRIIQFESDLDFCLRRDFIEGVRRLNHHGLSFDICVDWRHMDRMAKFADLAADTSMILDHIGKPAIKAGAVEQWARHIRELAKRENVACKISGVATEADHKNWTAEQLKRYIEIAIDAFGFDRVMFGGDWPVSTQAISYDKWIDLLDDILKSASEDEKRKFWRENAIKYYRLH